MDRGANKTGTHGFELCAGFFVSSIKPDMFFRKRLCIRFSSMSRSFNPWGALGLAVVKTSLAIFTLRSSFVQIKMEIKKIDGTLQCWKHKRYILVARKICVDDIDPKNWNSILRKYHFLKSSWAAVFRATDLFEWVSKEREGEGESQPSRNGLFLGTKNRIRSQRGVKAKKSTLLRHGIWDWLKCSNFKPIGLIGTICKVTLSIL